MIIKQVGPEEMREWQRFVERRPNSHLYHDSAWHRVLAEAYRVERHYQAAIDERGEWLGVIPLYLGDSPFTLRHMGTPDGGALAIDDAVTQALYDRAVRLRGELAANYLVIRSGPAPSLAADVETTAVWTIINVNRAPEDLWKNLGRRLRWEVNQGIKNGYVVDEGPDAIDEFHAAYARNMRDLGSPAFGVDVLRVMKACFGDRMRVHVVRKGRQPVGGMACVRHGDRLYDLYASVVKEHKPCYANYVLYWRVIEEACADPRVQSFDMGRSIIGSGNQGFKAKWPGTEQILPYRYYYAPGAGHKGSFVDKMRSGKLTLAQRGWQRTPLSLANWLGPILCRKIPFG